MALDLLFVGGGLASCLAAYRLAQARPEVRLRVLERGDRIGGSHIWSFHEDDLSPSQAAWIQPMVTWQWPRYEVRFPGHRRVIESGYRSIDSLRLRDVVRAALGNRVRDGSAVAAVGADHVVLSGTGERLAAEAVVDGTGFHPTAALRLGYQKFVGQVIEFARPIGLAHPIVMDATVDQEDGFRFVYVLPFTERTALIEDTYYSETPDLPAEDLRRRIGAYAAQSGWEMRSVSREESGVLPITLAGDFERFWPRDDGIARIGMRAGLFHPTTGYSLPQAVRTADLIDGAIPRGPRALANLLRSHAAAHWRDGSFFRGLNRMLLQAGRPAERYRVLERFYRLPAPLIGRFYAGRITLADRVRLLVGAPPVQVGRAVAALLDTAVGRGTPEVRA